MQIMFPEGVAPGEQREANALLIATDGRGTPILRGSSIAGVLRSAYERLDDAEAKWWFGAASDDRNGVRSRVLVADMRFQDLQPVVRTHNGIDRHRGAPLDGGLFSLAALPPGASAQLVLVVEDDAESSRAASEFLATIVGLFESGLYFGGNAARGVGRAVVNGPTDYRSFDLTILDEHAAWLDEEQLLARGSALSKGGKPLAARVPEQAAILRVEFALKTPRGQDVLFGGGEGCDFAVEPQRVHTADKRGMLRFPGSALRGVMRAWINRLAKRAGRPVADSPERAIARRESGTPLKGDELAWEFAGKNGRPPDCPVVSLFGSLHRKGRVHLSDALIPDRPERTQARKHVSVDRISGGSSEGFLFDSQQTIQLDGESVLRFAMTVRNPSEEEAEWLAATLRAIDLGVVRVGSSKSSGRLALAETPKAAGPHAELFTRLEVARGN
jgi:CRISPR/Cas system CSM-associated protein Csm3 (group 7 of RAMP superfamily)